MFPNSPFAHAVGSFRTPVEPPDSEPDDGPLSSVSINCDWLPLIRGALTQLLLQSTWKTDSVSLETTQKRAWRLINMFAEMECEMCDCLEFNLGMWQKVTPDGHGGTTITPVDPRTEGTMPAPWPTPPSGQTGNCLAGANIEKAFYDYNQAVIAALGAEAALFLLAQILVTFVDFVIPVIGIMANIALNLASAAQDAGSALVLATLGPSAHPDAYTEFQCALSCAAAADGTFDAAAIQRAKDQMNIEIPGIISDATQRDLWLRFASDFLDIYGPNGLTGLGNKNGIVTADCSACDCGWESLFDFTAFDYASLVYDNSPYSAGHGYVAGTYGGYYNAAFVQFQLSPQKDITHVTIEYTAHFNASVTQRRLIVTYYPEAGVDVAAVPQGDNITDGFNALHTAQDYVFADLLANDTAAVIEIHRMLVRGNGTKPTGWP